ncbi:tyrosine-type recombinase/integrase [Saccharopolyspora pogona]|uniref:tyrosine-type recombinase/integrase n=1 Tax=Saccharopolyspora pogona TaxID=333966 RepID=UPI001CC2380D|nr:tyrosine-type recombinase/integrase [Saccharopolyspora pogona]
MLAYLRSIGVATVPEPPLETPRQQLLVAYERYLTRERGLRLLTVTKYLHIASVFLDGLPDPFPDALAALSAEQVIGFVCDKGAGAKSISGGLRVFLRYLYLSGTVGRELDEAVPPAAGWKLSGLPARLDAAAMAAVMATCDRASTTGRRDYAILMLLARLGLRAHEVAGLELDDIRWRAGTVVLRRKCGRSEELPLPVDVGQALVDYLQIRPAAGAFRAVFMSVVAPRRPTTRAAVTLLARRHCAAAGVASGGARRLRHTLASDLLAAGASLSEIGLVLGHRSVSVTSIYAKVDRVALAELVRPWPLADPEEANPWA